MTENERERESNHEENVESKHGEKRRGEEGKFQKTKGKIMRVEG